MSGMHSSIEKIRLQKYLAARGHGARRKCETLIINGRVMINGAHATLGMSVCPGTDRVELDGHPVESGVAPRRTILLHKPRGYLCTAAAGHGRTVYNLLPPSDCELRIAGRLDKDSDGLVLLSNDGALVQRLTHPRHGCVKTYLVETDGRINAAVLRELRAPLTMDDGYVTRPAIVRPAHRAAASKHALLEFDLREGRNRQVRRLCERSGLRVQRLTRTALAGLTLRGLPPGAWRVLTPDELSEVGMRHVPACQNL